MLQLLNVLKMNLLVEMVDVLINFGDVTGKMIVVTEVTKKAVVCICIIMISIVYIFFTWW